MVQGDRPNRDQRAEPDSRREPREGEWLPSPRRSRPSDDELDLPAWGGSSGSSRSERRPTERTSHDIDPIPPRNRSSRGQREPLPQLGDVFRRSGARRESEDDRSAASTRDPYDRLRRVANQPQRRIAFDDEPDIESDYFGGYEDNQYEPLPPVPRDEVQRARRRQPAVERRVPSVRRPNPTQQLGGLLAAASPQVRSLAGLGAIDVASLVLMAVVLAIRLGSLPEWIPIHLNAEGTPDRWGTHETLWQIPLMAFMLSLMSGAVAWYLAKRDPFAARFTMLSTVLMQALAWIALVHFLK